MAKATDWGLTDAGFRRPTYSELLDSLEYKARELFGTKANLTVRSPLGVFLRIYAWALNLVFSTLEDVYDSRFIDTAVGHSLYNLGRAIGLRLLGAQKAVGYLTFHGVDGTEVPEGFLAETTPGEQYVTVSSGVITDGSVTLPATAAIPGPQGNVEAGQITLITNPKTGIAEVENLSAFEGGRDTETDDEFRARYYESVDFAGGVNIDAVVAEIYESVEAVIAVIGDENDTDEASEDGLPPHSIEIVAYGGLDEDIADAIYRRKAAGIQTYGNTSVPVLSASGKTYEIRFSRPTPVPVWVKVTNLVTDSRFPLDGPEQIKASVASFIGGSVKGGLDIGQDVIQVAVPTEVLKVSGVVDFDLLLSTDGENFSEDNVVIGYREKAVTDEGMVVVE
ncbi:MAG: baseplate J/gp47 family protein [Bacteroidales bacterium]|nr:baseplate J/gp47 family protein [Bacteroidales bacterium]